MPQAPKQQADPRLRAAEALTLVEDGLGSQQALRRALDAQPALASADRGLCTELVYGVLRRRRALDRWLEPSCRQGLYGLGEATLAILRLGALQLADLHTPPHAAVHATVEAAKRCLPPRQIAFVHAVLRELARRLEQADRPDARDLPDWLERRVAQWAQRAGVDPPRLVSALSQPAPLFIHALDGDVARLRAELAAEAVQLEALDGVSVPGVGQCSDGQFFRSAAFGQRRALAQDAASAAVVEWLVACLGPCAPSSPPQVADIAAGLGVKSARLAAAGAAVTAIDKSAEKLGHAAALCAGLGYPLAATLCGDATGDLGVAASTFDAVLLDAPCTALGTLRRRPELRHRRHAADILRMAELQRRLLDRNAALVRPGGVLIYAVCSFAPEEGSDQIAGFLDGHPEFSRAGDAPPWLRPWLNDEGDLFSTPLLGGADGFFAACLKKTH